MVSITWFNQKCTIKFIYHAYFITFPCIFIHILLFIQEIHLNSFYLSIFLICIMHTTKRNIQSILFTYLYWSKQLKDQPILLLSSFIQNSSINEHKNMKLRENICYETLIEFYIIVALGIICKRIIWNLSLKSVFVEY